MTCFPELWPIKPLGDLVDVLDSKRVPVSARQRADRIGNVPYYGATGQVGWIDTALFSEPLVLLGEDGVQFFDPDKLKSYLIQGPSWVNNHAHVLRTHADIDRKFLNYYLNTADFRGLANGTTRLKLTQAAMRRLLVPVPELEEQRRVVELLEDHLSCLDAAAASIRKSLRRADQLVVSSLAKQVGIGREQGYLSTIGEQAEIIQYGSGAKCGTQEGDDAVPVLRMGNVKNGALVWDSLKYLPASHVDFPKLLLKPGDLLFNRTNSAEHVGKSAVFETDRTASFASYLIRVRFGPSVIPRWASMVINSPTGREYIASVVSQQVGQANVNGTKLKSFPLPVPPLDEQARRVAEHSAVLEGLERLRRSTRIAADRAQGLRRSLLVAAFSGRLTDHASDIDHLEEAAG